MADSIATLLDRLNVADPGLPAAEAAQARLRTAALSDATRESWKYSRLPVFIEPALQAAVSQPVISGLEHEAVTIHRLRDRNRAFDHLGDPSSSGKFPLADLALLLTGDGLLLEIAADARLQLSLDFLDGMNVPLHIHIGSNAVVTLLESSNASRFVNQTLYLQLATRARVHHARTAFNPDCCHWSFTQVILGEGADYQLEQYLGGGRQRRHENQIILMGRHASAALIGGYRVLSGTHLDQQITVEHRAGATTSTQKFHGLGAGKGTAVFNGRIHIYPGAPGSDAQLSNRNLALHPDAIINTKPELEIYTDDVKCAHGATIGQLSADSLFYLQARGISVETARSILCRAFIRECIQGPLAAIASQGLLDDAGSESDLSAGTQ